MRITQEEQRLLLSEARETIAAALEGRPPVYLLSPESGDSALTQPWGAFVTLHIGKNLRGCIGCMTPAAPLKQTIRTMAQEAAFRDPRFPPLARHELGLCRIEISGLSPIELCPDPRSVKVGVHGLYLVHRGRTGVLLPQVPVEQGWDLEAYLDYICVKAGVPPKSYDEPGAKLYTFTATVFGESS
ncbi:MAG: AmmeMemoRadiSam system protein A [Treponema sp.]|jgi:AmmeMemoRadiSam system protein A|nr:AmmeMemoRadiSam system protein A [Treponema sp.]